MADPMWALVMFDLPTKTKQERREATRYRNQLLDMGFSQVQLSVYAKFLLNSTGLRTLLSGLKQIPPNGAVRILRLTDEQWSKTMRFYGRKEVSNGAKPSQLLLFDDGKNESNDGERSR